MRVKTLESKEIYFEHLSENTTYHLLIIGDALKVLKDENIFPDESVNLVVTSPPYGLRKKYGSKYRDKFNLEKWTRMIETVGKDYSESLPQMEVFF